MKIATRRTLSKNIAYIMCDVLKSTSILFTVCPGYSYLEIFNDYVEFRSMDLTRLFHKPIYIFSYAFVIMSYG